MRTLTLSLITSLMLSSTAFGGGTRRSIVAAPTYESAISLAIQDAQDAHDEAVLASGTYMEEMESPYPWPPIVEDPEPTMVIEESSHTDTDTDTDEPDPSPWGNPTYAGPEELVQELEINILIELRELVELHGEEHDLVGEIFFEDLLADIDQLIFLGKQMDEYGKVSVCSIQYGCGMTGLASNLGAKLQSGPFGSLLDPPVEPEVPEEEEEEEEEEGVEGPDNEDDDSEGDDGGDDDDEGPEGGSDDDTDDDLWWDPRWNSLIDLIDQAYSPVAFGEAVQTSLETTGLEGIRTLVDNQLDALEQLNAR
jgi:hypothetical protein